MKFLEPKSKNLIHFYVLKISFNFCQISDKNIRIYHKFIIFETHTVDYTLLIKNDVRWGLKKGNFQCELICALVYVKQMTQIIHV